MRTILALLLASFGFAIQPPAAQSQIGEQKKAIGFVFGTVHLKDQNGQPISMEMPLGTAYFVFYPDSRLGQGGFCYLVTAKHVLKDTDGHYLSEIKLRLNLKGDQGTGFIEHIPVSDSAGNLVWFHESDDAIDMAALPIVPQSKYDFTVVPITMFADEAKLKSDNVAEGDSIYFIGLMAQYYGEKKNYPVIRRGTLAMMTDEKIETPTGLQNAYIAELSSWPGNSGSPVFLNLNGFRPNGPGLITGGNDLVFLGTLSGTFLNGWKASVLDSTRFLGNGAETGISFIVPASRLKAILDGGAAQAARDEWIANQHH